MQYEDILDRTIYSWSWNEPNPVDQFLDFAGSVDLEEPDYSFFMLGVWVRKSDGQVLYAIDSGCSCPSPWEDTRVRDLLETTADRLVDLCEANANTTGYNAIPVAQVRQEARALQARVRELGGK